MVSRNGSKDHFQSHPGDQAQCAVHLAASHRVHPHASHMDEYVLHFTRASVYWSPSALTAGKRDDQGASLLCRALQCTKCKGTESGSGGIDEKMREIRSLLSGCFSSMTGKCNTWKVKQYKR